MAKHIIGVDEVGWGCCAGPIVVCAAYVKPEHWETLREWGFKDSKKVGNGKRSRTSDGKCDALARRLDQEGQGMASWAIAQVDPVTIDLITPTDAKNKAFRTAVMLLMHQNGWGVNDIEVIVDGNQLIPTLPSGILQTAIPKADDTILPASVASVLAKSYRDTQMIQLDSLYPQYGFRDHKGYPTPAHLSAILDLGPIKGIHRGKATQSLVRNYYERTFKSNRDKARRKMPAWVAENGWLGDGYGR